MESESGGRTVLVVEDFDDTRALLKRVLELKGYRVLEAVNGREAVEVATRELPDLILMDLDLPILDGIAATNQIRRSAAVGKVPIVAVTAYPMSFTHVKAFAEGCDEYIPKPIDWDRLADVLSRHLQAG